jgi:uncharacterized membrane protein
MFDTISGLPVHALVVHVVVVLLPLMALVTIAFVVRPQWRRELPWAVLGNAAVLASTYAARQSGGKLQARLSGLTGQPVAAWHQHLANVLPYYAIGQLAASVIAYLLLRRPSKTVGTSQVVQPSTAKLALAITLVLVAGVAATVWTYRVGDSGARAVWEVTIANTKTPG